MDYFSVAIEMSLRQRRLDKNNSAVVNVVKATTGDKNFEVRGISGLVLVTLRQNSN